MKVEEVMTKQIIAIDKDESLSRVLELMKKHNITKIPVVDNKKFVGIVTDNMIAYKLGSIRKRAVSAARLHASSVTEKNIMIITPNTLVKEILKTVGEPGPTMLPVLDDEKLIGVVTKANLLHLVNSKQQIRTIMHHPVHVVGPNDRIIHARRTMIDNHVARLPVVDEGTLIGMISDSEIAFAFADLKNSISLGRQKHKLDELLVKDAMRKPAVTITPSLTIADAAKVMKTEDVGALPITDGSTLIGIVTRTDLLKTISL